MTAAELVQTLRTRGVCLTPIPPDTVRIKPAEIVTPEEKAALRALKPEVLAVLLADWPWPHPPVKVPPGHVLLSRTHVDNPGCQLPYCVPTTEAHHQMHEEASRGR